MQKIDRTGEENINKQGLKMQIIRYKNVHDIDIQFEDGIIVRHTYISVTQMYWYLMPCKMYNVGAMLLNYTPRTLEEITGGATCL